MTDVRVGFDGKLPSRGDFVGRGLPLGFLSPWRSWVDAALLASRAALGAAWLPAWLEAPVWRFVLPAGACGPEPVLGLTMPSVDRAGRHYPLTVAAVFADQPGAGADRATPASPDEAPGTECDGAWLDAMEDAARGALALDQAPDALMAAITATPAPFVPVGHGGPARWWTTGSPRVPAAQFASPGMPAACAFAAMIDAEGAA